MINTNNIINTNTTKKMNNKNNKNNTNKTGRKELADSSQKHKIQGSEIVASQRDLQKGQHFMIDEELLERIVKTANITSEDKVLEIGSGEGALTKHILKQQPKKLACIELDEELPNPCEESKGEGTKTTKTEFIRGNALEHIQDLDFTTFLANIPYHLSEPLFKELFFKQPEKIIVVTGLRFAKKLLEENEEHVLGTVFKTRYKIELAEEIPRTAFEPQPRIKSALLKLEKKDLPPSEANKILREFFRYPRTKVKNYIEHTTEGKLTKRFVKNSFSAWINNAPKPEQEEREIFLNKQLNQLTNKEFQQMKDFIYFHLFGEE